MRHLDGGVLRRLYDDPLAVAEPDRAHFSGCPQCRAHFEDVAETARRAAQLLQVSTPQVTPPPVAARARAAAPAPRPWELRLPRGRGRAALAGGLALVAVIAIGVTGTAQQLFTAMEPTQVAVVPVTSSELRALPDLSQFGRVTWSGEPSSQPAADAAAAAAGAGFAAPRVGAPSGVPGTPRYAYLQQATGTFTFDGAMASAWAAQQGKSLPAMPSGIDGSTLSLTVGPAIVEMFGTSSLGGGDSLAGAMMAVGKMRAPTLTSTGPSVQAIEDYLLSLPGVSPDLAASIRSIGDPTTTLPLPVPVDRGTTQKVDVAGVQGVLIGDNTGLGAGVIWIKDGFVYGVGGTITQDQALAVARSLT